MSLKRGLQLYMTHLLAIDRIFVFGLQIIICLMLCIIFLF